MDLVNLLLLGGACHEAIYALRGKTNKQAYALAHKEWRSWARDCGVGYGGGNIFNEKKNKGEGSGDGFHYDCGLGYGSGHGHIYGDNYGYGEGGGCCEGSGEGYGCGYGGSSVAGDDLEIWHDGDWRGREWARSEIARLVAEIG